MNYSGDLVSQIQKNLVRIFGRELRIQDEVRPWVTPHHNSKSTHGTQPTAYLTLAWIDEARTSEHVPDVCLIPLVPQSELTPTLWFGLRIKFGHLQRKRPAQYELEHVSLYFARDRHIPKPLIRAEWDPREPAGGSRQHGQPHWHVHPGIPSGALQPDPIDAYWDRVMSRVHLAMAVTWGMDPNVSRAHPFWRELGQEARLAEWLVGCVEYLRDQLTYAMDHETYPSGITTFFSPEEFSLKTL